jgi:hypothetical protein
LRSRRKSGCNQQRIGLVVVQFLPAECHHTIERCWQANTLLEYLPYLEIRLCPQSLSSTHICFDNILLKSEYPAIAHHISQPSPSFLVFFFVFTVHTCLYPEVHIFFSHMHSPNLHPPFGTYPSNCFCGQCRRCGFLKIQI